MGFFSKKINIFDVARDAKEAVKKSKVFDTALEITGEVYEDVSKGINHHVKQAKKYIDDNPEYFEVLDDMATAGKKKVIDTYTCVKEVVIKVVNQIVDLFFIREQVKKKKPGTIRAIILAKKKNAVDVGIFATNGTVCEHIKIESDCGVSDNVVRGDIFDIYV